MARKEIKAEVEKYATMFRPLYEQTVQVIISDSNVKPFDSILKNIRVATLAMMKGVEPEKRTSGAGKDYTPPCLVVEFEDGQLFFVLEDIRNARLTLSGVVLPFDTYTVTFARTK